MGFETSSLVTFCLDYQVSGPPMKNENMNFLEDKQKELMNESL